MSLGMRSRRTAARGGQAAGQHGRATPVAKLVAEPAKLTLRTGESVDAQGHGVRRGRQADSRCARARRPAARRRLVRRRQADGVPGRLVRRRPRSPRARRARRRSRSRFRSRSPGRRSRRSRSPPSRAASTPASRSAHRATAARRRQRAARLAADVAQLRIRRSRRVDRFGNVTGAQARRGHDHGRGRRRAAPSRRYTVAANPGRDASSSAIAGDDDAHRRRDPPHGDAEARRRRRGGRRADHLELHLHAPTATSPRRRAAPGIIDNGLFVGELSRAATRSWRSPAPRTRAHAIEVTPRDVRRRITVTGRGNIHDTHTSDLWPYTGKDGRDYVHRRHLGRRRLRDHLRHHRSRRTS